MKNISPIRPLKQTIAEKREEAVKLPQADKVKYHKFYPKTQNKPSPVRKTGIQAFRPSMSPPNRQLFEKKESQPLASAHKTAGREFTFGAKMSTNGKSPVRNGW